MAVLTRSPTSSEFNHQLRKHGYGTKSKRFRCWMLALDEFQSEVAERGIDAVIFDMIKNLLHKIPTTEVEVNQGVEQYNLEKGPEYVISLMNDQLLLRDSKQDRNPQQFFNIYIGFVVYGFKGIVYGSSLFTLSLICFRLKIHEDYTKIRKFL